MRDEDTGDRRAIAASRMRSRGAGIRSPRDVERREAREGRGMRAWRSRWVWTFATLLCASSDVVGEDGAFEEEWKAGLPAALEGAAAVAAWSHDANLFAERDRLATTIVRLDRDHAKARA